MNENIVATGKIFELVQMPQPDGRVFEKARRAPGVRVIIADKAQQKVLLTREYRQELQAWDYRLPGGKVFDSLDEYAAHRTSNEDIEVAAKAQAINEAQQEAAINVSELSLYRKSTLGATVEWDLYVFEATEWQASQQGQQLESGEEIEADTWFDYDELHRMILDGAMAEERIALILLQWLEQSR